MGDAEQGKLSETGNFYISSGTKGWAEDASELQGRRDRPAEDRVS